jgi:hypothetical protein
LTCYQNLFRLRLINCLSRPFQMRVVNLEFGVPMFERFIEK